MDPYAKPNERKVGAQRPRARGPAFVLVTAWQAEISANPRNPRLEQEDETKLVPPCAGKDRDTKVAPHCVSDFLPIGYWTLSARHGVARPRRRRVGRFLRPTAWAVRSS